MREGNLCINDVILDFSSRKSLQNQSIMREYLSYARKSLCVYTLPFAYYST
jgi:hypothetical protein